jgi:RNA polymerase sigma factor (sigma-70 family)
MDDQEFTKHLSQISTAWTALLQAHGDAGEAVGAAQRQLLHRYSAAVYRYLLGAVRDRDVADELFQEFALRFVRGDFRRADPQRGRFRDFIKTSLYHLVVDHQRRQRVRAIPLSPDVPEPVVAAPPEGDADERFLDAWRGEIMARAWEGLAEVERQTGQPLCSVLRLRTDHPELSSAELAERMSARLGRPLTDGWVRKRLHLARSKYTDLLVDEVARSLGEASDEALADELLALGLLDYCRAALARRG